MKEKYYSNWLTTLLSIGVFAFLLAFGYQKYGFTTYVQLGCLGETGLILWSIWERYTTYIAIEDNRWLLNSEQQLSPNIKVDIASILYIARAPHFIFRSWGGRMVMYFRDDDGRVRQTNLPETLYTWTSLTAILKRLISIKPSIELDPQYRLLISKKEPLDADLAQNPPRPIKEIEAYVASKYGPP